MSLAWSILGSMLFALVLSMVLIYLNFRVRVEPVIVQKELSKVDGVDHLLLVRDSTALEALGFKREGDFAIEVIPDQQMYLRTFSGPDKMILGCIVFVNPSRSKICMTEMVSRFDDGEEWSTKNQPIPDSFKYPPYRKIKRFGRQPVEKLVSVHRNRLAKARHQKIPVTYSESMEYTLQQSIRKEFQAQVDFGILRPEGGGLYYRCTPYGAIYMTFKQIGAVMRPW